MGEDRIIEGKILKGIGGFYYVKDRDGDVHECKAAGRFRKEKMTPLPGDNVSFSPQEGSQYGFIDTIHPRKNQLIRPQVANIDQVIITMATQSPKPDLVLIDKLLISALVAGIEPLICVNKRDLAKKNEKDALVRQYSDYFKVFVASAKTGVGMKKIKRVLTGKTTCFAGQSAVGKSSILNAIFKDLELETGGLSKKTERGKHTTRHAELIRSEKIKGYVVDTPGFSLLESGLLSPEAVGSYYPEIRDIAQQCKFAGCLHKTEPECAVKDAVENGKFNQYRYERYLKIIEEIEERRKNYHD